MARGSQKIESGGHFGVGIYQAKHADNVGTLWRGAYQLGAAYLFTIGPRYRPQTSDPWNTWQHIPLFSYASFDEMIAAAAYGAQIVGVEMGGTPLPEFTHPEKCIYLLGAEDSGLPQSVVDRCHQLVSIPAIRAASYNVAQAGTLVMYDRMVKLASAA